MSNILVVDDSLVMRKNIIAFLTRGGHTVIGEAVNGKDAVVKFIDLKPDLVTMDISMPKMDGIAAVTNIMKSHPEAKIIMISAVGQKYMVLKAISLGAKNYIVKPIDEERLLEVIDEVLNEVNV